MVTVSWVYLRRRDELLTMTAEFGLETQGTVSELRSRMAQFIAHGEHNEHVTKRLEELEQQFLNIPESELSDQESKPRSRSVSPVRIEAESQAGQPGIIPRVVVSRPAELQPPSRTGQRNRSQSPVAPNMTRHETPYRSIAEKVHRWGILFDGQSDPLSFIERVEERAAAHQIALTQLSRAVPEMLTGNASDWFRVSRLQGATWDSFKRELLEFFLPPRYFQRLEDQIRARQQKPRETFKAYVVELRLLMRRAGYTGEEELDRAYENLLPEYQLYIRRHEASSLAQLTQLATDFEFVREREWKSRNTRVAQQRPTTVSTNSEVNQAPRHRNPFRDNQPDHQGVQNEPRIDNRMIQETGPAIDVQRACRRCAEIGHYSRECRNRQVYFCWRCGKRGVRTWECCDSASGNGQRSHLPQDQVGATANQSRQ